MTDFYTNPDDKVPLPPRRVLWAFVVIAICLPIMASIIMNYEQLHHIVFVYLGDMIPDSLWFLNTTHKYIGSI